MKEDNSRVNATQEALERSGAQYRAFNAITAHLVFWPLTAVVMALDLASKEAVFNWLEQKPGNSFSIIDGFLRFVIVENPGGAFGIAAGRQYLLVGISVFALIAVLAIFLFSATERKSVPVALGMFAGGVCGNLWDRIFNGGLVRDFIDVYYRDYHWPAFNIADAMLCVAVALLLISTLWAAERSKAGSTEKPFRRHGRRHK